MSKECKLEEITLVETKYIDEIIKAVELREFNRQLLEIEIRKLGNGCPFDPIAKCNLKPGDSCAEIECPVWLESLKNDRG